MSTATGPTPRNALVALTATLAIQMYTSLAVSAPPVLAPVLAADLGVSPKWIGVFISLLFAGAMAGSLVGSGFVGRYGAIRVSQVSVLFCAAGIGCAGLAPASAPALLVAAAVAVGMGYGPITAASSDILIRTTPPHRLAVTFSIKQTGVPAGTALAGALMPALALLLGWRGAFIGLAVVGLVVVAGAETTRQALDRRQALDTPVSLRALVHPLRLVLRTPALREMALIGFTFAAVQVSLTSFLVIYVNEVLAWSLITAGLALTCATTAAVAGRIFWGIVADRWLSPVRTLALIGFLASVSSAATAFATAAWPAWVVLPLAALFGATAIGWNGVQLAELARRAPAGQAASVTGATGFVTFSGVVGGPSLFALVTAVTGSYRASFLICALICGARGGDAAATSAAHALIWKSFPPDGNIPAPNAHRGRE